MSRLKQAIESLVEKKHRGEMTTKEVMGQIPDLLRKWPDHVDGPLAMVLADFIEEVDIEFARAFSDEDCINSGYNKGGDDGLPAVAHMIPEPGTVRRDRW